MNAPETLSLVYFPIAVALGALHALEPGHAKTLTAAYLIGIRGTKRDALALGLAVAATHSLVVIAIAAAGLWLGRETFTDQATRVLQLTSGAVVIVLGLWLFQRRWRVARRVARLRQSDPGASPNGRAPHNHGHGSECHQGAHDHPDHDHSHHDPPDHDHSHCHDSHHDHDHLEEPGHEHSHEDHDLLTDEEHARAHAAALPGYVNRGERPGLGQIVAFGAAGGLIPCPASITVMLLAISIGEASRGALMVLGFSLGLAAALVGVGLLVVVGLTKVAAGGRFSSLTAKAPLISAALVVGSGVFALLVG